jgi:hypothetical protein
MPTNLSLSRSRAFLLAGAIALGSIGCGDETGLLISVTRDEQSTPASIDHLRFFIGTAIGANTFVEDETPLRMVELGAGRDILSDPYKLLLREADSSDDGADRDGRVMIAVLGLTGQQQVAFGTLDAPVQFVSGSVLEWEIVLHAGGDYDLTPTDCLIFEGGTISSISDADCDGDVVPDDCNDHDPSIGPSAAEICENGVDDDCNGMIDEEKDGDGDGFTNCEECDDSSFEVNPEAQERCDGIDNDCDGTCDVEFDADEDGYTVCGSKVMDGGATCLLPDETRADCNDESALVFPGAEEVCDGFDNDCNNVCDDGFDVDGDLYTTCGSRVDVCNGVEDRNIDCQPEDETVHPGAIELCNGRDDNCDGKPYPAASPCYGEGTNEGGEMVCAVGTRSCNDIDGDGGGWGDCSLEGAVNDPEKYAPIALCDAYTACDAADAPDPFACANTMAADAVVSCTVYVADPGGPVLCEQTYVPIPVPDKTGCYWSIVGGRVQRHWEAALSPFAGVDEPPTGGAAISNACAVWFEVVKAQDAPPVHDSVMLWHGDAGAAKRSLIKVDLMPALPGVCPAPGMECGAFPDLAGGE